LSITKGIFIRSREVATAPIAGIVEIRIIDTSIEELKPLITITTIISIVERTAMTTVVELKPTAVTERETVTTTVTEKAVDVTTLAAITVLLFVVGIAIGYLLRGFKH